MTGNASAWTESLDAAGGRGSVWTRGDAVAVLVVASAALLVFINTLGNGWILDDQHQVLRNRLIQEWPLLWRALTSDVWAFVAGDGRPGSNYWRPTFVLWNIGLWHAAGPASPLLWHLANVLLHVINTVLCLRLCRLLGVGVIVAASIAVVFACHPTRTESVAWIGGATDLVLGFFVLLTLNFYLRSAGASDARLRRRWFLLACLAYLPALGSKEVAVLLPLPIAVIGACTVVGAGPGWRPRLRAAVNWALPPALMAAGYMAMRMSVLSGGFMRPNSEVTTADAVLSSPSVLLWYLGKAAWPQPVEPMYVFDILTPEHATAARVVLPALICAILMLAGLALAAWPRRGDSWARWVGPGAAAPWPGATSALVPWFGAALFGSMLAPAMNLAAFGADQPVHDRYLYVPLIGLMLVVFPAAAGLAVRVLGPGRTSALVTPVCAAALAVPLTIETVWYNRVWEDETTLWETAVELEPRSAISQRLKGLALNEEGRVDEARRAFLASIQLYKARSTAGAVSLGAWDSMVSLAAIEIEAGRPAEAERLLREVEGASQGRLGSGGNAGLATSLSIALDRQGRTAEAEQVLRAAIAASPRHGASLGDKLAICLYKQGRKDEAQRVLEEAVKTARSEPVPGTQTALFRLGMLYAEQGRQAEAKQLLEQFLLATRAQTHRAMAPLREQAAKALKGLGAGSGR